MRSHGEVGDVREEIVRLAREYSAAHKALAAVVEEVRAEQREALRRRLDEVLRLRTEAQVAGDVLRDAVAEASGLFSSAPRTWAVDDVRVGYRKRPGKLTWDDPEQVCAAVERHLPEQAAALIRVKREPVRAALKSQPAAVLAAVGVRLEADTDEMVLSVGRDDLAKILDTLLADEDLG